MDLQPGSCMSHPELGFITFPRTCTCLAIAYDIDNSLDTMRISPYYVRLRGQRPSHSTMVIFFGGGGDHYLYSIYLNYDGGIMVIQFCSRLTISSGH